MAEDHRRDTLAHGWVVVHCHPSAIEELSDLNQPGDHWIAEIDEDPEWVVFNDRPMNDATGWESLLG